MPMAKERFCTSLAGLGGLKGEVFQHLDRRRTVSVASREPSGRLYHCGRFANLFGGVFYNDNGVFSC